MPIQFHGMIRANNVSEIHGPNTLQVEETIEPGFIRDFARAHEAGGFDRVLVGYHSGGPDAWLVAAQSLASTERLGVIVAHRPGFVAPTLAARKAITLDHLSDGRASLNIVTGGSDADQARDGDWTTKDERYRRTDEYLGIVRKVWESDAPFDHEGEFYRVAHAASDVRPTAPGAIPIFFGGASDAAIPVAAKHADVYMLWGEPVAAVRERIAGIQAVAPRGRRIAFSVSFRPILGSTEAEAWDKAHAYLERILAHRSEGTHSGSSTRPGAAGSQRLLDLAAKQEVWDRCLWTPIAAATGAGGNTTALVGTPEQVAAAILDYHAAGVGHILIRGFEPLDDALAYGRDLIPLVRDEVARREHAASAAD